MFAKAYPCSFSYDVTIVAIENATNASVMITKSRLLANSSFPLAPTEMSAYPLPLWVRAASSNVIQSWTKPTQSFAAYWTKFMLFVNQTGAQYQII